jgi:hypothetical protein
VNAVREPLQQGCWRLSVYPTAGEAGGSFRSMYRRPSVYVLPGSAQNPDRARTDEWHKEHGLHAPILGPGATSTSFD